MQINNVLNTAVNYGFKKPLKWVSNRKVMTSVSKNFKEGNAKYIAGLGILSIILKDGLGCYLYVKQSLNNKNIPEEKRKFVAALDLTNGGLMILSQLLMFKTISNEKFQGKIFERLFGKFTDEKAGKKYFDILKNNKKIPKLSLKEFQGEFSKLVKEARGTFGVLTSLVAATIIAKRVIVPFIATPMADKAKKLMDKHSQENSKDTFVHKDED